MPNSTLRYLDERAPHALRLWLREGGNAARALACIVRAQAPADPVTVLVPDPVPVPTQAQAPASGPGFPLPDEALTAALNTYSKARGRLLPADWFPVQVDTDSGPVVVEFAPPLHPRPRLPRTGFRVRWEGHEAQHKAPDEAGRIWT